MRVARARSVPVTRPQLLYDKSDLTAASCLFVDDFSPKIEAAENAGMQGIVFHDAGQLREELKARGIL